MPLNLPALNRGNIRTQGPQGANKDNQKSKQRDGIDDKESKQVDELEC